jgi:hypothetical protein
VPGPSRRDNERASRRSTPHGPAFISDQAEEQHYLDTLQNPAADPDALASARMELARLLEQRGEFDEAIQLYQENIWAGVRTPATHARLAAAYRTQGRDDLADATLEQIRRTGGAVETSRRASGRDQAEPTRRNGAVRATPDTRTVQESARGRALAVRTSRDSRTTTHPVPERRPSAGEPHDDGMAALRQIAELFLTDRAGQRTLVGSMIVLPIIVGVTIVAVLAMSVAKGRSTPAAPAPTPAPVATVAPTPVPTSAIPAALSQPPASTRLIVSNVGSDGLSLRKAPGSPDRIKVWPEGTEMVDLGQQADQSGKQWRQVRAPDGVVGWAASDFLIDPAGHSAPGGPAAAPPAFASGGLGLSREAWEQSHGAPTNVSLFLDYDDGRVIVGLSDNNIWHIERVWPASDAATLEAARDEARNYLPADATLSQSVDKGEGSVVDVYSSPSLTSRFAPATWNTSHPGTFAIKYRYKSMDDHHVTSAMFRLGDQPF